MSTNYPPGVTGTEDQIASLGDLDDAVVGFLDDKPTGASESTIARALGVSEYDVGLAIERLLESDTVRETRRTKTSIFWGTK